MARTRLAVLIGVLLSSPVWAATPWSALTAMEKRALAPLAGQWASMDDTQQRKWRAVVEHYDTLMPEEQVRVQRRMIDWSRLSPQERARALDQYRALRSIPPEEREALQQRWQEYQRLSPEERARAREQAREQHNKNRVNRDKDK
ncbi:DUF3106 domain-containing protein [Nitrogeniibacter mangrovi]|uniref:DUF3106 domain-containing protein n=1 Tax=Nitrogeniibacter mangrovi TaxID=2016596 RepID=A0A6C1B160_9RHOO|nr:DUF3106 domain-containing protein [Nitrogeniibacter mangrovi]QID17307.1 DUF3106 domain-containing protein [Nitrogeniibacter mangrovi]